METLKDCIKCAARFVGETNETGKNGLGLKSIRNIADKYVGNMHYEYDEEKRTFTITVMIRRPGGQ